LHLSRSGHPLHLHPFPTRRSSDLDKLNRDIRIPIKVDRVNWGVSRRMDSISHCRFSRRRLSRVTKVSDGRTVSRARDFQIASTSDRKSTRLNSSHVKISYAVFCLK